MCRTCAELQQFALEQRDLELADFAAKRGPAEPLVTAADVLGRRVGRASDQQRIGPILDQASTVPAPQVVPAAITKFAGLYPQSERTQIPLHHVPNILRGRRAHGPRWNHE